MAEIAYPDPTPETPPPSPERPKRRWLSPLNERRWRNFRRNRRAYWSLMIFTFLFVLSLFAEFIANDKPILVNYRGDLRMPVFAFYSEQDFGGDFPTEAGYSDPEVQCLIVTGGLVECFDDPDGLIEAVANGEDLPYEGFDAGWMIWPIIPYSYNTVVDVPGVAPAPPSETNWLGTDDTKRDVVARVIYGFRLSVFFALVVTAASSVIGIVAGAVQGYFGGWTDLLFQRFIEIWTGTPSLYVIIIIFAILGRSFWLIVFLTVLFGWPALVGVVRAEFLRARNFEYVRAARALGVSNRVIMFRHMLPNAMVATVTMLPFLVTGAIATLASLDFLGFGLPSSAPSLGELTLQAKQNLQAPWLGFTAFFTFAIMLSLLVFIFEGVRDAFDPRKTFS
ncbi:ABC transporter permease [Ponticoccus sp. SC2-23]|uniref:ABC transporter permease n=1 Tax=Alexandriicola marinus TaxID=2081710 RepID=UPI000FDAD6FF|nr:ABC transporter permease [Alexandriicola marinus]MBM1220253.1 ABC transporter permease [Ponticoccus sp. SC6-9]MBM1224939.1 ABC transporter permease [Ponticoccus sp. SC6-15]MBM1228453.1 ABC transporter permease [Ponticoccus sp. SC6-38]MBM1233910.1 ABC transporter permease [Ponticoccus sp. SC6-45]MBM1238954.1 ABC transporter permease [Ponticoccus sp. SC6-49]MBM1242736.1 ABC transporter permease [Ponticoccus sp. SC2-64]MBM1247434.1 ABC transporter permease [Ponticoccus sp. SC6-42]MBM1251907